MRPSVFLVRRKAAFADGLISLPVQWNPAREDHLLLKQSAILLSHYYQIQMAVHRPFISKRRRQSPLTFPSLIICTNAARSAVRVVSDLYRRTGDPVFKNVVRAPLSSRMNAGGAHLVASR